MSGQLGDLVVSFSADIARFQTDMGKASKLVESSAKQMTGSLDAIPAMFGKIGAAAGAVTAVLAGGAMFKGMIDTTKEVNSEVVKLTKVFGISAEQASVMRVALDDAFLSVDDAVGASDRLTRASIKNGEAFTKAGIDIHNSDGSLKYSLKIMMEVNDYLKTLKEGKDRDTVAMALYGKGWREFSGILRLTSEGMKEAQQRAEELHLVWGDDKIAMVKKYRQAMKDVDDVFESVKVQLGSELIPALTQLAIIFGDAGTKAVKGFGDNMKEIQANMLQLAMLADKAGGSITRLGFSLSGGTHTSLGKWFKEQNDMYQGRYLASDVQGQELLDPVGSVDPQMARAKYDRLAKMKQTHTGGDSAPDMTKEGGDREKEYIAAWNSMQDKIREMNPALTEHDKAIQKMKDEYETLTGKFPEHRAELTQNMAVYKTWIDEIERHKNAMDDMNGSYELFIQDQEKERQVLYDTYELTLQDQEQAKQRAEKYQELNIQLLEMTGRYLDAAKARAAFVRASDDYKKLSPEGRAAQDKILDTNVVSAGSREKSEKAQRQFDIQDLKRGTKSEKLQSSYNKDSYQVTSRMDELNSVGELNEQQLQEYSDLMDKQLVIDKNYAVDKKALDKETWERGASTVASSMESIGNTLMQGNKRQFELGKALAIAGAGVSMMQGAIQAYTSMTSIPYVGPAFGAVAAAAVIAAGTARIAQIESTQYTAREMGGPVEAGKSYIVGEKRPELFTPGASGFITPSVSGGGGGSSNTQVFQISTGVSDTVRAEVMRMAPQLMNLSVSAVRQNIESGGDLAYSVGRA